MKNKKSIPDIEFLEATTSDSKELKKEFQNKKIKVLKFNNPTLRARKGPVNKRGTLFCTATVDFGPNFKLLGKNFMRFITCVDISLIKMKKYNIGDFVRFCRK